MSNKAKQTQKEQLVVPINAKITLEFICHVREAIKVRGLLNSLNFNNEYKEVTPDFPGGGYPYSPDRPEVCFHVTDLNLIDAAALKQTLPKL